MTESSSVDHSFENIYRAFRTRCDGPLSSARRRGSGGSDAGSLHRCPSQNRQNYRWRGWHSHPAFLHSARSRRRSTCSAEEILLDQVDRESTVALLAALKTEHRDVLLLRVVANLPLEQVAKAWVILLGLSRSSHGAHSWRSGATRTSWKKYSGDPLQRSE